MSDETFNKIHSKVKYGAVLSPIDERDYKLTELQNGKRVAKSAMPAQIEKLKINSKKLPTHYLSMKIEPNKVFDQGLTDTCCACATAMSRYYIEYKQTSNVYRFSPAYIYGNRCEDAYIGEGMCVRDALEQLKDFGCCTLYNYNYFGNYETCHSKYSKNKKELDKVASYYKIDSYYSCDNIDDIKHAIYATTNAIVVIPIYEHSSPDSLKTHADINGVKTKLKYPEIKWNGKKHPNDEVIGYHAMLAVGWTAKGLILLNSWGSSWGNNGLAVLPYDYPVDEAWTCIDTKPTKAPVAMRKKIIVSKNNKKKPAKASYMDNAKNVIQQCSSENGIGYDLLDYGGELIKKLIKSL